MINLALKNLIGEITIQWVKSLSKKTTRPKAGGYKLVI
jgi:hypothetical protein